MSNDLLQYAQELVLFSLPENPLELRADGLKILSQSHRYNHTDIVCIASALVVVVCFKLNYNQLISLVLL